MLVEKTKTWFFLGLKNNNTVEAKVDGVEAKKKRKSPYERSYELCKCRKCLEKMGENTKGVRKRPNKHCPFTLPPVPPPSPKQGVPHLIPDDDLRYLMKH